MIISSDLIFHDEVVNQKNLEAQKIKLQKLNLIKNGIIYRKKMESLKQGIFDSGTQYKYKVGLKEKDLEFYRNTLEKNR